jgi:hypothetical protein
MSCSGRWPATLTAFDALKAARGPEGANDTMSLVLFNHTARVEFSNEPLTGNTTLSATPEVPAMLRLGLKQKRLPN